MYCDGICRVVSGRHLDAVQQVAESDRLAGGELDTSVFGLLAGQHRLGYLYRVGP